MSRGYMEVANVISGAAMNINGQTTFSKEFPMGEGWYKMMLRIGISVVIGTGTTPIAESELLFIKGVMLKTDRGELLCNLPGRALYKIAVIKAGSPPRKDAMAAATAVYYVNLPIIFVDWRTVRPEDTVLDTSRYSSVSLQITLGTVADLFTVVGTSSVTATLDCEIERSYGPLPFPDENGNGGGKPLFHISYDYRPPVDASVNLYIDLERSPDMSVKRYYVHSGTAGTAGVPFSGANSDAIQSVINLKDQNRFIQKDRAHAMIRDHNKDQYSLESVLTGIEVFDFIRDGSLASALATADKSVLQYAWTNQGGVAALSIVTCVAEMIRTLK